MLSARIWKLSLWERTDAGVRRRVWTDVMRTETEDNRRLGKNCSQGLCPALGLKFNLNFFSLIKLSRGREEGEGDTEREYYAPTVYGTLIWMWPSFNVVYWYRFLEISNWLFICIYYNAWKSAPHECKNKFKKLQYFQQLSKTVRHLLVCKGFLYISNWLHKIWNNGVLYKSEVLWKNFINFLSSN